MDTEEKKEELSKFIGDDFPLGPEERDRFVSMVLQKMEQEQTSRSPLQEPLGVAKFKKK